MSGLAYTVFATAIGRCALVWRCGSIVGAALPEPSDALMCERLSRRFPDAVESPPPPEISEAIDLVARSLQGEDVDLSMLPLDLAASDPFEQKVYAAALAIPRGEVRTYGELAAELGQPGASRAVGAALGRNPIPIVVPCHRILAASGRSGGFSAPGGTATKFRILAIEGARRSSDSDLFETLPLAVKPA
ncbi:MAG: cysteine methyltransferase [Alphaproteobacteria bacterium]|nr:cysteine methyltransferase [Alphaproteobacteria bacterium]